MRLILPDVPALQFADAFYTLPPAKADGDRGATARGAAGAGGMDGVLHGCDMGIKMVEDYVWDYGERFLYIMEIVVATIAFLWVLYLLAAATDVIIISGW